MNELNNIEKSILANIDWEKGSDNIQINLAMKLNLFKREKISIEQYKICLVSCLENYSQVDFTVVFYFLVENDYSEDDNNLFWYIKY